MVLGSFETAISYGLQISMHINTFCGARRPGSVLIVHTNTHYGLIDDSLNYVEFTLSVFLAAVNIPLEIVVNEKQNESHLCWNMDKWKY